MVDDLPDIRRLNALDGLGPLVVIHQDDMFSLGSQQVPAGDHAQIFSVRIQDREITVTLVGHDVPNIIDGILIGETDDIFHGHKIADGHGLVDQSCRGVCIIGRGDHRAAPFLGQLPDGQGNTRALADNDAACLHLNGAELGFVPVSQDHQVMLFNIILHQIRICGGDQDLSLIKICIRVSHHNAALQGIQDVGILGIGLGDDAAVIQVHVGFGDISDGDDAL